MKLDIDVRGVKPALLSRLAGDIEAPPGHPVAAAIGGVIRAAMQSGEPESVSLPLIDLSPVALNAIGGWAQEFRDSFAKSPWPALAELFNSVMLTVRDEELLRRLGEKKRQHRELFGEDDDSDDDAPDDAEWTSDAAGT